MTHVFYRNPHASYPLAHRGDGIYIHDKQGKQYLDASGGAAVSCLGHSHQAVRNAIKTQIERIAYAHSGFFSSEAMEKLATRLITNAPGSMDKVYFVSGGSEAVEAALKLSRQYFTELGEDQRRFFIARKQSYHGNTLGALAVGGNEWRRKQFKPLLADIKHISPCYAYRLQQNQETEADYSERMAGELETMILQLGAENVIGFICEPVVGATLGAVGATQGYLKRVREICNQYGILLILDEVMCGMGRTGYFFAHEEDGVDADLVTIAKGLGAGYQPIGATLVNKKIFDVIYNGSGYFQHGHTYMGHATACAASLAVLDTIEQENLLENVRNLGELLQRELESEFSTHDYIGDIRGRGLFRGIEFVKDKTSKETFDPALKINVKFKQTAMENGLICYPMGGTIDGVNGDHVLLAPPFIINETQIDEVIGKLKQTVNSVFNGI